MRGDNFKYSSCIVGIMEETLKELVEMNDTFEVLNELVQDPEILESINRHEEVDSTSYNCWGFTAYVLGWTGRLRWLEMESMDSMLAQFSRPLKSGERVEPGDIAVYRGPWSWDGDDYNKDELLHTAVVVSREKQLLIHKPGECPLELQNFDGVLEGSETTEHKTYDGIDEFRRPIPFE